jgi:hypothetical protein
MGQAVIHTSSRLHDAGIFQVILVNHDGLFRVTMAEDKLFRIRNRG